MPPIRMKKPMRLESENAAQQARRDEAHDRLAMEPAPERVEHGRCDGAERGRPSLTACVCFLA